MCRSSASTRACRKSAASARPCASTTSRDPSLPHAISWLSATATSPTFAPIGDVTLHFSVQGRFESFMARCKENGVTPRVLVTDESKNNISKVVTQLLSLDHMPTAIACQEDGIAVPLLFQLERNGFTVPNDVSIIGYDDSIYARDLGLTTVRQKPIEMAQEAAA